MGKGHALSDTRTSCNSGGFRTGRPSDVLRFYVGITGQSWTWKDGPHQGQPTPPPGECHSQAVPCLQDLSQCRMTLQMRPRSSTRRSQGPTAQSRPTTRAGDVLLTLTDTISVDQPSTHTDRDTDSHRGGCSQVRKHTITESHAQSLPVTRTKNSHTDQPTQTH